MRKLIDAIELKHRQYGIDVYAPATHTEINSFEQRIGFPLPSDFKDFYSVCDGIRCNEDIFNILPLSSITKFPDDYVNNWFYFSEYMIYSDTWGLRIAENGRHEIFNGSYPERTLTSSLTEFLNRFLQGNVFEPGGLYDWHDELGIK